MIRCRLDNVGVSGQWKGPDGRAAVVVPPAGVVVAVALPGRAGARGARRGVPPGAERVGRDHRWRVRDGDGPAQPAAAHPGRGDRRVRGRQPGVPDRQVGRATVRRATMAVAASRAAAHVGEAGDQRARRPGHRGRQVPAGRQDGRLGRGRRARLPTAEVPEVRCRRGAVVGDVLGDGRLCGRGGVPRLPVARNVARPGDRRGVDSGHRVGQETAAARSEQRAGRPGVHVHDPPEAAVDQRVLQHRVVLGAHDHQLHVAA